MPLYDYKCPGCGEVFEALKPMSAESIPCVRCKQLAQRQISAPRVHLWEAGWQENLGAEPVWVESKKQMREECEKRGLVATNL